MGKIKSIVAFIQDLIHEIILKTSLKTSSILFQLFLCFILYSCSSQQTLKKEDLEFTIPFQQSQSVIYSTEQGLHDTIYFDAVKRDTLHVNSIEQGFYQASKVFISYRMSPFSYHQFTVKSMHEEPENFIQFELVKNSHSSRQISFLGLVFDEEFVLKQEGNKSKEILFQSSNAQYVGVNINEPINQFLFDKEIGILQYSDEKNRVWKRIQME